MECKFGERKIFYEAHGTGRPIVLLPGRPSDHKIMERFMEPLFAQRPGWLRLYPDLPGTGLTPSLDQASHDQMLEAVLAFIDAVIPGQRFVLAGFSYGGYMARGVLARRTSLIDGVMLCVPQVKAEITRLPAKVTLVKNPQLLATLDPDDAETVEFMLVAQTPGAVKDACQVFAEVRQADHTFNAGLEQAEPASFEAETPTFDGPTLILTARQDNVCGYLDAWDLLAHFPRATFAVIDQAGHLMNIEQTEGCHALIRVWLDRVEETVHLIPRYGAG